MNVSDARFVNTSKGSFDFEECTAIEIDSWKAVSQSSSTESVTSTTSSTSSSSSNESLITIFAQSIEIIGSSVSPWPAAAATSKTLPEQVAGIFITSETVAAKEETKKHQQTPVQSKLRHSTSSSRRLSITRINEEHVFDAQKIFNELEPIPIISPEEKNSTRNRSRSPFSPTNAADIHLFENQRKGSRLQQWLSSLYSRNGGATKTITNNTHNFDEECAPCNTFNEVKPLKSILKKSSKDGHVQKSVTISETEAIKMSHSSAPSKPKQKKAIKLRFDNEVSVCETFHKEDYSRQSLDYVARQLTPSLALAIKKELNSVKQEMEVHEEARHLTQFYLIK